MILGFQEDQNPVAEFDTLGAKLRNISGQPYLFSFSNKADVRVENTRN